MNNLNKVFIIFNKSVKPILKNISFKVSKTKRSKVTLTTDGIASFKLKTKTLIFLYKKQFSQPILVTASYKNSLSYNIINVRSKKKKLIPRLMVPQCRSPGLPAACAR